MVSYKMDNTNREIEVRFLEIDKEELIEKLQSLGALDLGEDFLREIIFYDKAGKWQYEEKKFVRIRETESGIRVAFKHNEEDSATGTTEIEFGTDDARKAKQFLEKVGLIAFREQEKRRRTFKLGDVIVDIDTWPKVPTYVELEGPSEEALKMASQSLNLDWSKVVLESPRFLIEKYYHMPVSTYRYFTFGRVE